MAKNKVDDWEDVPLEANDWEDVPVEPKQTSKLKSAALGGLQGLTFGTSDEIEAGGKALYSDLVKLFGKDAPITSLKDLDKGSYKANLKEIRERYKKAQEDNPASYLTGELTGGLASGLAIPGSALASGAKGTKALLQAAKIGAIGGAAAGAGYSEAEAPLDVLKDASIGATGGAVLGPLMSKYGGKLMGKAVASPVVAGTTIGAGIGAGKALVDDESVLEGALTGGAVGAAIGVPVKAGVSFVKFGKNLPFFRSLGEVAKEASEGRIYSTKEGQDAAVARLTKVANELPEQLEKERIKLLNLRDNIINKKAQPQDVAKTLNSIVDKNVKQGALESIDDQLFKKTLNPFTSIDEVITAETQQKTAAKVFDAIDDLSTRMGDKINNASQKMKKAVESIERRNPIINLGDDLVRFTNPSKAPTILDKTQVDLIRKNVAHVIGENIEDVTKLQPTKLREVITSLNELSRQKMNFYGKPKAVLDGLIDNLEKTLLQHGDEAAVSAYNSGRKELGSLRTIQDIVDVRTRYNLGKEFEQGADISSAVKDLTKLSDPSNIKAEGYRRALDNVKDIHPDLVDYLNNKIMPVVKEYDTVSSPGFRILKGEQVKTPEEIVKIRALVKEINPLSEAGKETKETLLKELNDALKTGLKTREAKALSSAEARLAKLDEVTNLIKGDDVTQLSPDRLANLTPEQIRASNRVINLSSELRGMKKTDPSLDVALSKFAERKPQRVEQIKQSLDKAQKGKQLADMFAQTASTEAGMIEKTRTLLKFKAGEILGDANANIQAALELMKKNPISATPTGKDLIDKLNVVLSKEGQQRQAYLFALLQRPEYRNIINELVRGEDE